MTMEILDKIKKCKNNRQLYNLIRKRLVECVDEGIDKNDGCEVIGEMLDINPNYGITLNPNELYYQYDINVFWNQFIPPNVKIVFGIETPDICHNGYYYYMNDYDYIFEFVKYIKDQDVYDESEFVGYVFDFMRKYFNLSLLNENLRERYFKLICDQYGRYFPPSEKRSNRLFKGSSMARCTELGATGQNIMSFFGMDTLYVHDQEHAYNIVKFSDESTFVVDFAKGVYGYNIVKNKRFLLPFMGEIENCTDEVLQELVSTDGRLQFNEYGLYILGNSMLEARYKQTRSYGSGGRSNDIKKLIK